MKMNKKSISNSNKTTARLLSIVYIMLAVMVLSGAVVLNSPNTSRPFWLSAKDSMGTLTFLTFLTVLVLNFLTSSIFSPLLNFKKEKELDERQKSVRLSVFSVSFGVVMFILPVFLYFLTEQINSSFSFNQSNGGVKLPILAILLILIGLPSAIASWRKDI